MTQFLNFPYTDLAELGQILDPSRFVGQVLVAYGATEARALELEFEQGFTIDEDEIDWVNEDLVGPRSLNPDVVSTSPLTRLSGLLIRMLCESTCSKNPLAVVSSSI